jgi:hypothetical protein
VISGSCAYGIVSRKGRWNCQCYPRMDLDKCFRTFALAIYYIKNRRISDSITAFAVSRGLGMVLITAPLSTSLLFGDILNHRHVSGFADCRRPVASWCAPGAATIAVLLQPVKRPSISSSIECSTSPEVCEHACDRASST